MSKLTLKQRKFIDELFECGFNGTEAARRAGYSGNDNTLGSIASQNLRKIKIVEAIEKKFSEQGISAEYIIWKLKHWADLDISDFYDETGKADLQKAIRLGKTKQIKRIRPTGRGGLIFEFHDPMAALIDLAKMYGLIEERMRVISEDKTTKREDYYYTGKIPKQSD